MVGGDYYSTALRHVLGTAEFNLPKQVTEKPDDRSQHFKRPLRKHRAIPSWPRFYVLMRKCAVVTQANPCFCACILQRPFLINEFNVNSRNAVAADSARSNGCMCGNALLLAR